MYKKLLFTGASLIIGLFVGMGGTTALAEKTTNTHSVEVRTNEISLPLSPSLAYEAPTLPEYNEKDKADIKVIIIEIFNDLLAKGTLKGAKGDTGMRGEKGDSGIPLPSSSSGGFQPALLMGASVIDTGTFFAATNLSSDNITSTSGNIDDLTLNQNLSVVGTSQLATVTATTLEVETITSSSGAYLSEGGAWVNASSKSLKENFATTSEEEILTTLDTLPLYTWNYKNESTSTRHLSPVAEDFYSAFKLGGERGEKSISTIDPAGIALVAIQGLNKKFKALADYSWMIEGWKKLGIEMRERFIGVENFMAKNISTEHLEIGSPAEATGIVIYDQKTQTPICISVENGVLQLMSGKCGDVPLAISTQEITIINEPTATTSLVISETNENIALLNSTSSDMTIQN